MAVDQQFLEDLQTFAGKYVQVRVKRSKAVDAEPGVAVPDGGFYFTDYQGDVMNPAIRTYPEDSPTGPLCLYLQTRDQQQKVFALAVDSIDEVDDEVKPPAPMHVSMNALTNPSS